LYAGSHPIVHLVEGDTGHYSAPRAGVNHVSFRSEDFEGFIERLRKRGIEFQMSRVPTLGHRQVLVHDPLGIGVEVIATLPGQ